MCDVCTYIIILWFIDESKLVELVLIKYYFNSAEISFTQRMLNDVY